MPPGNDWKELGGRDDPEVELTDRNGDPAFFYRFWYGFPRSVRMRGRMMGFGMMVKVRTLLLFCRYDCTRGRFEYPAEVEELNDRGSPWCQCCQKTKDKEQV
jgi:hypothetical protein